MSGIDEHVLADATRVHRPALSSTVWLIGGLAVLVRLIVSLRTHFTSEDFLITLRYAENLASGKGLVYNAGERVLGTTTPLYTLLLAGITWAGLPATLIGKLLGIAADGLLCAVLFCWLRDRGLRAAGLIAALFMALNPVEIRWAISGMETSLVTLCGVWVWFEIGRKRTIWAFAALGLLFLLRWDSVLMLPIVTGAVIFSERRMPIRELVLCAAIIAPWIVAAWVFYGNLIPITGHAKMVVYGWRFRDQLLPGLPALGHYFVGTPLYLLATVLAILGFLRVRRERLTWMIPPLIWLGLYWAAFLWSKVLLFEWYVLPTLPIYAVLVALGTEPLVQIIAAVMGQETGRALARGGTVAAAVGVTLVMSSVVGETQRIEDHLRIPIGRYLASAVPKSERVMLEPIGYIGYYSQCKVLDAIGLVSPEVLPSYSAQIPAPFLDIARRFKPEWILLRPGELQHILDADAVWWRANYTLVQTFSYTPRSNREPITFYLFRLPAPFSRRPTAQADGVATGVQGDQP